MNKGYTIEGIMRITAAWYGVDFDDVVGERRYAEITHVRHMAMLMAQRYARVHSFATIGGVCGGRDHSTVITAVRHLKKRIAEHPHIKREADELAAHIERTVNQSNGRFLRLSPDALCVECRGRLGEIEDVAVEDYKRVTKVQCVECGCKYSLHLQLVLDIESRGEVA